MAVLEVLTEDLAGRTFRIDQARFTIGRHGTNDLVLPRKFVSRRHAEILSRGDRVVVRGLSKKNPILHRNRESQVIELKHGEVFEICGIRFRFNTSSRADKAKVNPASVRFSGSQPGMKAAPAPALAAAPEGGFDSFENDDWGDDGDDWASDNATDNDDFGDGFGTEVDDFENSETGKLGKVEKGADIQLSGLASGEADWVNKASAEASRERFVFGGDEAGDFEDDERTEVVNLNDSNEQTGAIDLLNLDANLDDPFEKVVEDEDQEVVFKALISICLVALVVAAIILFMNMRPEKPVEREPRSFVIRPGEVEKFEFRFTSDDKPDALSVNGEWQPLNLNYAVLKLLSNQFVSVYWVLPYKYTSYGYLLVEAKTATSSTSSFTMRFGRKGDYRKFVVKVEGKARKEEERRRFLENIIKKDKREIKAEIKIILGNGDNLWKEREHGFPSYYKKALDQYLLAKIAYEALAKKVNTSFDPTIGDINNVVSSKIKMAQTQWNDKVNQQRAAYELVTQRNGGKAQRIRELQQLLKVIHDKKTVNYQIYEMLLKSLQS